jgi:hypothetical protein
MDEATTVFPAVITTGVAVQGLAAAVRIGAPRPNPFNGSTAVKIQVARGGEVDLSVYSVDGRRVRVLVNGYRPAGEMEVIWDGLDSKGRPLPAGLYFATLRTAGEVKVAKLAIIK